MRKPLKIIIFDGSFKTTTFINRLAEGLTLRNKVYILGFNVELTHKLDGVQYVPLGSNQIKLRFIITSLSYAFQTLSIQIIWATLGMLVRVERHQLQEQNLSIVLRQIQPDIIHLQWPSVIPWFEQVLREQNIPVVLSQRGSQNNVRPFVEEDNFKYLQEWYPKISGFHSVSKAIQVNGDKIWTSTHKINKVVYTGLPFQQLHISDDYVLAKHLNLLSVGRAHWVKGYDYALQTCKILIEKNVKFHYTIIGGAGDEELQFLLSNLGLLECVTLIDRLPQTEVFKKMREASLLLVPSVEEGLPNVAVEAMALGLPVISANCGGVSELIEDGVEGWIVPVRSPSAMAERVVDFSKFSLEKIKEVRLAARKKVELQHGEAKMVKETENLYNAVRKKMRKT